MARVLDSPIHTNDQSIDRVLSAGLPVVVVFYNGSLEAGLEQVLKRAAGENAGKALVARVEVKDNPASARRFNVGRLPALAAVRDGKEVSRAEGFDARVFEEHLAYLLGRGPQPVRPAPSGPARGAAGDGHPRVVTDASYEQEVLRSPQPVLVDFWAPWCGPCRMTEPVVEKMASEMAGQLRVAKVNVDENPRLSSELSILSIPTMLVVKNGKVVDRWSGALPEQAVRSRIRAQLS